MFFFQVYLKKQHPNTEQKDWKGRENGIGKLNTICVLWNVTDKTAPATLPLTSPRIELPQVGIKYRDLSSMYLAYEWVWMLDNSSKNEKCVSWKWGFKLNAKIRVFDPKKTFSKTEFYGIPIGHFYAWTRIRLRRRRVGDFSWIELYKYICFVIHTNCSLCRCLSNSISNWTA